MATQWKRTVESEAGSATLICNPESCEPDFDFDPHPELGTVTPAAAADRIAPNSVPTPAATWPEPLLRWRLPASVRRRRSQR